MRYHSVEHRLSYITRPDIRYRATCRRTIPLIEKYAPCEGANAEEEEPKVRTATAAAKKVVERSMVALVGLMLS